MLIQIENIKHMEATEKYIKKILKKIRIREKLFQKSDWCLNVCTETGLNFKCFLSLEIQIDLPLL